MPFADQSHKHAFPVVEAVARELCDLSKDCIARRVHGEYQEFPECKAKITSEMIAGVRTRAETRGAKDEERLVKKKEREGDAKRVQEVERGKEEELTPG
ncbi:hypothetical protein DOTSEDRAFT_20231 [Dothistroma septosporum NZE10]|uniref:Uncharacterized protein n=1 Tax=Dothistroma septosporum (strain NZE10 / CBS 128990) TaxID=675120 RepID=N1Q4Y1_DOTSN|nr:hypothetical protein DOTSEDRAFT_20231 [Dothistroma septosporum NZE10]